MNFTYAVIGGGTAGHRLALMLAKHAKTILFEPDLIGGTCLNTGCIPTKAMLRASHMYHEMLHADEFGILATPKINFKKVMDRVRSFPQMGQSHVSASIDKNEQLVWIKHPAQFKDAHTLIADITEYTAQTIIIATGATNFVPPIPGIHDVNFLDNRSLIYDLNSLPKSLVMVGGGYISMEFATFFAQMGTKVTILERLPSILAMLDQDVVELLVNEYQKLGVDILTNVNITNIKKQSKYTLSFNDVRNPQSKEQTITAEQLVVATGRIPNTKSLALEKAGVNLGKHGEVLVGNNFQTNVKHIYAIGDVTGKALFAHAAKRELFLLYDYLIEGKKVNFNFDQMPWAVFTSPPVAGYGESELTAHKKSIKVDIKKAFFAKTGRASIIGETKGFVKLILNKSKIIGCQIIGPRADDLVHEIIALMHTKQNTIETLQNIIHIHPTLSEVYEQF